jgi:tetratricopeptide (TPR) repeat protein
MPRASIANAINQEPRFQQDGLTNTETVKELGKRLGAEYVLSGSIVAVGQRKLLLISIIQVEYLQQVAGVYREYEQIEDVDAFLPDMARQIGEAVQRNTRELRELSVVPLGEIPETVNRQDAEVLIRILAAEIVRGGRFAVFLRTKSLEQVMMEDDRQGNGETVPDGVKRLGRGEDPGYVLSVNVRNLGAKNMVTAAIVNRAEGSQEENGRVDYETIAEGLKAIPVLASKLTGVPAESAASAYNNRGTADSGKKDYDKAIANYTEAILLDPQFAKAYFNRGVAQYNKKDYDRAIADYTQAIRLDPNYASAYYNRGLAYDYKKDYDKAIADYTEAIRLNPRYALAYNNRGYVYYNGKKDYNKAIADYTEAIRFDPNFARAYTNRGNTYKARGAAGDQAKADADYAKAASLK